LIDNESDVAVDVLAREDAEVVGQNNRF